MPTWKDLTEANPAHSHNYAHRWKMLQAQGKDIHGEARLIDAMVERGSRVLDAGCGTGRLGGELARRGHEVVGVDIDPVLIEYAKQDHPQCRWHVGDLSAGPLHEGDFDIAVAAGNVFTFLAVEGRETALRNILKALHADGRFVCGFGEGRGWSFQDFLGLAQQVGFEVDYVFSSWDLRPFTDSSTFMVAVLSKPGADLLG